MTLANTLIYREYSVFCCPDTSRRDHKKNTTISICNRRDSSILAEELIVFDHILIQVMSKSLRYAVYFYVIVTVSCIFGSVVNMAKIDEEKISLSHITDATSRLMHSNGKHLIFTDRSSYIDKKEDDNDFTLNHYHYGRHIYMSTHYFNFYFIN